MNYAEEILKKGLFEVRARIQDVEWWIRTLHALIEKSPGTPEEIEASRQKLRVFQEERRRARKQAADLRSALKKI